MPNNKSVELGFSLIEEDASKVLGLTFGSHKVEPGQYIPRGVARTPPEISFSASSSNTYMVISIDIDPPFVSWNVLGPALHWIQSDLKARSSSTTNESVVLNSSAPFIVNYIGPSPPPGAAPHRYVFYLYEQPSGFDVTKYAPDNGKLVGLWGRARWSLDDWEKEAGLGKAVAMNYFKSN
ncbi:putative protease inhibitor [Hypoxylon trugodes]|uniref:putative protease inhibitor n=1 Tax=Hypoxylon trugodes TaxID=326681 RepID=UPI00219C3775|nr:putative protease inhibitor [Hypoxylon trugodes]KAI1389243.1 putative protease inhibitor [Hypoxylon trugodes]